MNSLPCLTKIITDANKAGVEPLVGDVDDPTTCALDLAGMQRPKYLGVSCGTI